MSAAHPRPEPFLPPKELGDALVPHGIHGFDQRACRRLVHALKSSGLPVVRFKYVRASDAAAWLLAHPDWRPYSSASPSAGVLCVG